MRTCTILIVGLLVFASTSLAATRNEPPRSLLAELETLDQANLQAAPAQRRALLRAHYGADASIMKLAGDCASLQAGQREAAFTATQYVNFYLRDPVLLARMRCLLDGMQEDGNASTRHFTRLHAALVAQQRRMQQGAPAL